MGISNVEYRNGQLLTSRLEVEYINNSSRYLFTSKDYSKQFADIYSFRLKKVGSLLEEKVRKLWGHGHSIKKLADLREDNPEKCIIIGTLFKHQQFKPSILREISEENQLIPQPPRQNYVDDSDKLILEDELQRIRIFGKIEVHNVVTGIVCAVLGYIEGDSKFFVEDYTFYDCAPQKPLIALEETPLLLILSGLDQSMFHNYVLSLELFQQWLCGNLSQQFGANNHWDAGNIVRLIIAGNSVQSKASVKSTVENQKSESFDTLQAVGNLDKIFSIWSETVQLDVMPGELDPSNYSLPQQPFHKCMFQKSSTLASFKSVTNPYACEIAGRTILGTSGQNIDDIRKTSKIENSLEALRCTLHWGHIAPTSPDTLSCYPYVTSDVFIIEERPHIYFCGNQTEFRTDLQKDPDGKITRLICVPSFSITQSVVLVNLHSLECRQISFKCDL